MNLDLSSSVTCGGVSHITGPSSQVEVDWNQNDQGFGMNMESTV